MTHSNANVASPEFFNEVEAERYGDPFKYRYLPGIAEFNDHADEKVLEVGVGLGTDILQYARGGSDVFGIDLTHRAVELTKRRFSLNKLSGTFKQASFTEIPFEDNFFDLVYSFGVLHHSEETQQGIDEIHRVLKPGGRAIVMLYHKGFKYYVRKLFLYGVLKGEFLRHSAQGIVSRHSETFGMCPLTKAYSRREAAHMFEKYKDVTISCYRMDDYLKFGGRFVSPSRMILPDGAYRRAEDRLGWNLIIKAGKPVRRV